MTRLLISGGTGFVGGPAVRAAVRAFEVHTVARTHVRVPGITCHSCDLLDRRAVTQLIERVRPTHLLHLAWIATPGVYWTAPENHSWVEASKHLLFAFAR
jgi:nucleoside-diphosphate-sugar epimerase